METEMLRSIKEAISEKKARWVANENPILILQDYEKRQRLGVNVDERRLDDLRRIPKPDLHRFIAEHAIRIPEDEKSETFQYMIKTIKTVTSLRADALKLRGPLWTLLWWIHFVDWRNRFGKNAVTPIKDQGGCGSCVAFGTIATLESMVLIERNIALDLSEAELLFCGGGGCGGWWPDAAVTYLQNRGVAHESCFPYQDHNMTCSTCAERDGEAISIRSNVVCFDIAQRKDYLAFVGPMMCVFEVFADFFGYQHGVYSHVTGGSVGYHCVEVIGYDDFQDCWICKNSWGMGWGDNGYFRIGYGQCQIDSTFPFWGISRTKWWT